MPPDYALLQDVRRWLPKAELDSRAAAYEIPAPAEQLWGEVVFRAHLAAEKRTKAVLARHDVPFRKTRMLEELGQR